MKERKISVGKADALLLTCRKESRAEDMNEKQFYHCLALRLAKKISIDAYGYDGFTVDFYNLFSAIRGFALNFFKPLEVLKSLGFEVVDKNGDPVKCGGEDSDNGKGEEQHDND